jgi:hypothetical protein
MQAESHRASFWVPERCWAELVEQAKEKDVRSDQAEWTRRWSPDFNLAGCVGEWLYELLTGIPRRRGFGDGGNDFPAVDVKASKYYADPYLRWILGDPMRASFYVLAAVDLSKRMARYVGYATSSELSVAPIMDFGRGPRRVLSERDLHHELVKA